jgi:hypothetical protein
METAILFFLAISRTNRYYIRKSVATKILPLSSKIITISCINFSFYKNDLYGAKVHHRYTITLTINCIKRHTEWKYKKQSPPYIIRCYTAKNILHDNKAFTEKIDIA